MNGNYLLFQGKNIFQVYQFLFTTKAGSPGRVLVCSVGWVDEGAGLGVGGVVGRAVVMGIRLGAGVVVATSIGIRLTARPALSVGFTLGARPGV